MNSNTSLESKTDSTHMGKRCYYCNAVLINERPKTRDHIIPVSKYGCNDKVNIVEACKDCNVMKANLSLEEFIEVINDKVPTRRRKKRMIKQVKLLMLFRDANEPSMVGSTLVRVNKKKKRKSNANQITNHGKQ